MSVFLYYCYSAGFLVLRLGLSFDSLEEWHPNYKFVINFLVINSLYVKKNTTNVFCNLSQLQLVLVPYQKDIYGHFGNLVNSAPTEIFNILTNTHKCMHTCTHTKPFTLPHHHHCHPCFNSLITCQVQNFFSRNTLSQLDHYP